MFDTIIRNVEIYDGTGGMPFVSDVAIQGQRIAQIGDSQNASAACVIDVQGLALAPGFIDVHTHDDT
ncbi:D-aminoacylase, partial [Vibrio vulnificus]